MARNAELQKMIVEGYVLVTVNVLYFMPDHEHLLNEFSWQTLDLVPNYPRVTRFLTFWEREIEGRIKEVTICNGDRLSPAKWQNGIIVPV